MLAGLARADSRKQASERPIERAGGQAGERASGLASKRAGGRAGWLADE